MRIDLDQMRGLLARAVMTKGPDFVYMHLKADDVRFQCSYMPRKAGDRLYAATYAGKHVDDYIVQEGDPCTQTGCLAGVVIRMAGGVITDGHEGNHAAAVAEQLLDCSLSASSYLKMAQHHQDHGGSWGESYNHAENLADILRERYGD